MIWLTMLSQDMRVKFKSFLSFSILISLILENQISYHAMAQTEISKSFFTPFSTEDYWKTYKAQGSNYITNCGSSIIFGGPSIFTGDTTITKTIILPAHYKLKFEFKFWRLDPWQGSFYTFYIDGFKAYKDNPNVSTGTQICGSNTLGEVYQISNVIDHNGNSAIITLISLQPSASWGISDFILSVFKCPKGCDYCDQTGNCLNWSRMLIYFNTIVLNDGQGWKKDYFPYDNTQVCGSFYFYGQFLMTEIVSNHLSLPDPHTKVRIQFKFLSLYVTGSITIKVQANSLLLANTAFPINIITSSNIICGSYLKLDKIDLGEFLSSSSTLTITIEISAFNTVSTFTPFYGIRDFEVYTDAQKKQELDQTIICSDNNIYAFDGCFSNIYDCNEGCRNCIKGLCTQCLTPWILHTISGQCFPKCGDQIVVYPEKCDDGNDQPFDGCYECQFSCPLNCIQCEFGKCQICNSQYKLINNYCQFTCYDEQNENIREYLTQNNEGYYCQIQNFLINNYMQNIIINTDYKSYYDDQCNIKNYGIFAYEYNICQFETPQNCKVSFLNECQICQEDFEISKNNLCIPKCGNGIIQEYEICDDDNSQQFDGCYECQISCQIECLECNYSQCFKCIEGWSLSNFKCISECGDGKVALLEQEQCDDKNSESNDGCFECKFECKQNCIFCNKNLDCIQCQEFFEVKNQECVPICGDGIVIEGIEQCDDGNQIEYDGCHQCLFQCQKDCQICDQQKCLDSKNQLCETGYYLINNQCHSICGDQIIVSNEQCDDGNEIPYDGCYLCEFSCSLNCLNCVYGQCFEYDDDYYNINNTNYIDVCGNGIKSEQEECDDNNLISLDGCSDQCQIEINWTCTQINYETSICVQINPPHFQLLFINQTFESTFVQLKITSKVKLKDSYQNFTESLKASLIDVNVSHYIIYYSVLSKLSKNITYKIVEFNLYFNILNHKIFFFQIVQFENCLIDQFGFEVENYLCKLHLKNAIVLTESQKLVSHKISSLNMYILIGLGISSFIILLSGNPVECFEVLDTMQYQSNLKFINANFPENVMIFFQSSEVVTIMPVLEKFQILNLLDNIMGQEQIQAFGMFLYYNVNSDLISNLSGLVAQIGMTMALLIASKIYIKLIFQKFYNQLRSFIYKNNQQLFSQQFASFIHQLNVLTFNIHKIISMEGVFYIIQANSWDLLFKILLYLFSKKDNNLRNLFQNIIASSILIIIMLLVSSIFKLKDSYIKQNKRKSLFHEGLIIIKKLLFLLVLIGSQNNSLLQLILIPLINSIYLTIIILGKMIQNRIDLIIILMFELPVIIFCLLSIPYVEQYQQYFSQSTKVLIGFGQIGLLSLGIMAPLVKYGFQIKRKLRQLILKWKRQKKKEKKHIASSLFI